ncbi:hemagglutinin/amebocyte aggregation factor-like [Dreissena polymorpha]|uniref:Dermatopontin n=1 Tax=Dreissena polymorpha TaxID=45954 RepID=A0A9D4N9X5_DREPO|nr:hemagglutinin/amebocyte aggregation factor-like [Dreissena polymorpha]KAH3890485.1 hypothetical protein DPMN_014567 [Dreissena polymorpha]
MHLLIRLVVCTFVVQWSSCWNNDWDGPLRINCPSYMFVATVRSEHSNTHEDRRFLLTCRNVAPGLHPNKGSWCKHSGNVNNYDQTVNYQCEGNGYISGMESVHNNGHEDRIWGYRCCWMRGISMDGCYSTGWTNEWDGVQNYRVRDGYAMVGVHSVHDNTREDRRFEYRICKITYVA